MKRRLFHLHIKENNEHKYYGSLTGLLLDNEKLGVSKSTLQKYDWVDPYENVSIVIRKGFMSSANDVRSAFNK